MKDFSFCADLDGPMAGHLAIIAAANHESVSSVLNRLLDKQKLAEAGRMAIRKLTALGGVEGVSDSPAIGVTDSAGDDEAAGGSSSVSESHLTRDEKPSVAVVVVDELPDDDLDASDILRCVLGYYDWMEGAVTLLARHQHEQPDGCDCAWCHDLTGQRYTLEGFLSCLECQLPGRYLHTTMLREDRLHTIGEGKGE